MTKLKICGINVNLVFSSPQDWANAGMGRSSQISNTITLREGMNKDVEGSTLLHEVIHLIADMNALSNIANDETTISVLANSLFAFLADNKFEYGTRLSEDIGEKYEPYKDS
jgi:hypothetical protein